MKKVQLQKIASLLGDVTTALNSWEKEVVLAKIAEVAEEITTAEAEAPDDDTPPAQTEEQIQNAVDTAVVKAVQVELKKYADLYVSAADFKSLLEDIKKVTDKVTTIETLAKTTEATIATLSQTPAGSKQDTTDIKNTAKTPLQGLAARL